MYVDVILRFYDGNGIINMVDSNIQLHADLKMSGSGSLELDVLCTSEDGAICSCLFQSVCRMEIELPAYLGIDSGYSIRGSILEEE